MIRQLILPTFFVVFTFTKILWDPPIKAPYTLHAKKQNLPNNIKYI
jgi:hypothetical protein